MPISDAELQILIEKIALDHNWDLNAYKWPTLKRRIKARMIETQGSVQKTLKLVSLLIVLSLIPTYFMVKKMAMRQMI